VQQSRIQAVVKALQTKNTDLVIFTDIDGTFYKWQLLIDLVNWIAESFPEKSGITAPLRQAINDYHHQITPFGRVIELLLLAIPEVFAGIPKKRVANIAANHIEATRNRVYAFPKAIYQSSQKPQVTKPRVLVAITGAPNEVAEPLCAKYGFDVVIGAYYKTDSRGLYTGKRDIDSGINKGKILDAIKAISHINWSEAMALGDSETDIPMFERCGYSYAVNPNSRLVEYVRANKTDLFMVRCGQKSQTQIFAPDDCGRLIERCFECSMPADISAHFPSLPGLLQPKNCSCGLR
jgi:HAD superfamily phosphoserine phosphatase-like hydrolase